MIALVVIVVLLLLASGASATATTDTSYTSSSDTLDLSSTDWAGTTPADAGGTTVANSSIDELAQAIATQEGFGIPGAVPTRNNNPGDLRPPNGNPNYWAGQVGTDGNGFAIFDTVDSGWAALRTNLTVHVSRNPNQTLAQYIAQYAPAADSNQPVAYAAAVAKALGASVTDTLGDLFA